MRFYILCTTCFLTYQDTIHGETIPQIVGGEDAIPGKSPWMVSLQSYSKWINDWEHNCGGAIIDRNYIISAAHCYSELRKYRVLLGAYNVSLPDSSEPTRKVYEACRFHIHPDFHFQLLTNDMMVIKLKKPIQFTDQIQPIRSAPSESDPVGQTCVLTGCGWGGNGNLQVLNTTVISNDECQKWEGGMGPFKVNEFNVCTLNPGRGASKYDSGSPLVCYDDKGPYVAGLDSFGYTVGEVDVYAGVKSHLDFIMCKNTLHG